MSPSPFLLTFANPSRNAPHDPGFGSCIHAHSFATGSRPIFCEFQPGNTFFELKFSIDHPAGFQTKRREYLNCLQRHDQGMLIDTQLQPAYSIDKALILHRVASVVAPGVLHLDSEGPLLLPHEGASLTCSPNSNSLFPTSTDV